MIVPPNAPRCDGMRSALHRSSQCSAFAHAARCIFSAMVQWGGGDGFVTGFGSLSFGWGCGVARVLQSAVWGVSPLFLGLFPKFRREAGGAFL